MSSQLLHCEPNTEVESYADSPVAHAGKSRGSSVKHHGRNCSMTPNRSKRLKESAWKPQHLSVQRSFLEPELPILLKDSADDFKGYAGVTAPGSG